MLSLVTMKRLLLYIAVVFVGVSTQAQDTSEVNSRSVSNFFNLGVNAGIGGDRIHYGIPMVSGKVGPFYVNYSTLFDPPFSYSFNVGVDIIEINKKNASSQTCITFSAGASDFKNLQNSDIGHYNVSVLAGVSRYLNNRNLSYSIKVGAMEMIRRKFLGVEERQSWGGRTYYYNNYDYSYKYLPYGEITVGLSLFKHRENPATLVRPFIEGINSLGSMFDNIVLREPSDKFKKYFNPYLTVGVGGNRFGAYPTVGFETGRLFFDGITLRSLGNNSKGRLINIGYNFRDKQWNSLLITPSVSIHTASRNSSTSTSNWDGSNRIRTTITRESRNNVLIAGVAVSPKNSNAALKLQAGIGGFGEEKTTIMNQVRIESQSSSSLKIKPVVSISLILKMFENNSE